LWQASTVKVIHDFVADQRRSTRSDMAPPIGNGFFEVRVNDRRGTIPFSQFDNRAVHSILA
jgi:hypothetical protein